MKRVLIITYYWPPSGGSGVQRWVKFSKFLPEYGWQPVIYTPENPELIATDDSLSKDIPHCVEVVKTPIFEPYDLYRSIFGDKKEGKKEEVNPINHQKKSFKQRFSMFIRGNFFIPDPRCFWIRPSVKFLKKYLEENPVDLIVSTGPPHSMHLIGMRLAKKTGLPWVADFRDPWTKMFYFKHLKLTGLVQNIHHKLEKKVLDRADCVVAVSPLVQDEFNSMTHSKVSLITNGYDEEDFIGKVQTDGLFNINHTGLFASDGNPELLWEVLAEKCNEDADFKKLMRLRLAGKNDNAVISSIINSGLEENLINLGYQSHLEAIKVQRTASILILPLRKEPEYRATLPGKLFEYLAARRPILGIGQTDGAMARILSQTCSGVVFNWDDKNSIKTYINYSWGLFKAGKLDINPKGIEIYSRQNTTKQMAELMDSLIKGNF